MYGIVSADGVDSNKSATTQLMLICSMALDATHGLSQGECSFDTQDQGADSHEWLQEVPAEVEESFCASWSVCVSSAVNLAWTWINRDHQAQEQLGSPLCSQVVKDQVPCGYQTLFWPLLHTEYIYILLGQHLYDQFHQADLPRICSLFLNPLNFHGKQGASSLWNRTTGINSSSTSRQVSSISWLSWEADL